MISHVNANVFRVRGFEVKKKVDLMEFEQRQPIQASDLQQPAVWKNLTAAVAQAHRDGTALSTNSSMRFHPTCLSSPRAPTLRKAPQLPRWQRRLCPTTQKLPNYAQAPTPCSGFFMPVPSSPVSIIAMRYTQWPDLPLALAQPPGHCHTCTEQTNSCSHCCWRCCLLPLPFPALALAL